MIIDKLIQIVESKGLERKRLIKEFQEIVWNDDSNSDNPAFDILCELAYDLDFYEPDEKIRKEDSSYYGDERLQQEIVFALNKLEAFEKN